MFGIFEIGYAGRKSRLCRDMGGMAREPIAFDTIEAGFAHFGDKVVEAEIEDGAGTMFVVIGAMGTVYTVEAV